jgi:hypothetical protein
MSVVRVVKCPKCNDTGVIETGNNDIPCDCVSGDHALFNVAGEKSPMKGKELKTKLNTPDTSYQQFKHCDDYVSELSQPVCLRWFLFINRLPAIYTMLAQQAKVVPKLFATYQGKRVRVTMASRLGDVGITDDLRRETGYDIRIPIEELSDFDDKK